jgi:hypothetical protein
VTADAPTPSNVIGKRRRHLRHLKKRPPSKDRLLLREWLLGGLDEESSPASVAALQSAHPARYEPEYFEAAIAELSPSAKAAAIAAARRLLDQLEADALGRH